MSRLDIITSAELKLCLISISISTKLSLSTDEKFSLPRLACISFISLLLHVYLQTDAPFVQINLFIFDKIYSRELDDQLTYLIFSLASSKLSAA